MGADWGEEKQEIAGESLRCGVSLCIGTIKPSDLAPACEHAYRKFHEACDTWRLLPVLIAMLPKRPSAMPRNTHQDGGSSPLRVSLLNL